MRDLAASPTFACEDPDDLVRETWMHALLPDRTAPLLLEAGAPLLPATAAVITGFDPSGSTLTIRDPRRTVVVAVDPRNLAGEGEAEAAPDAKEVRLVPRARWPRGR